MGFEEPTLKSRTRAQPVFPAPDHDHGRCSADAMAHAEALCVARGERLTPIRRQVLETLAAQPQAARRL